MGFSESSNSTLYIGKSTTLGVEPTTYQTITPTGFTLSPNAGQFESEDLDPTGLAIDTFRTSKSGQGDVRAHWRPEIFDAILESQARSTFGSAFSATLTVSFGAPTGLGLQTITDDGIDGFALLAAGGSVTIAGAVAVAGNAGIKRIVSKTSNDEIVVYNPGGSASAADAGVTFAHAGSMTLGTTSSWQWIEAVLSDGVNLIRSEWYKNCIPNSWAMEFPAAGPTRCTFGFQGDKPIFRNADGAPPILKQRGGTDVAASTNRLVHGMDDVREIVFHSATVGQTIRLDDLCNTFSFTLGRNVRQDAAVGTADIINTAPGRATISGSVNAFINATADGPAQLDALWDTYPDDLEAHITFGATDATLYTVHLSTVRMLQVPAPVDGNDRPVTLNAQFRARNMRITRF